MLIWFDAAKWTKGVFSSNTYRRFNSISNRFLWYHVEIESAKSLEALHSVFTAVTKRNHFGSMVKGLSISQVNYIESATWKSLLDSCSKLKFLCIERCHIEDTKDFRLSPNYLNNLEILVVSDCPSCPIQPFLHICQRSPLLTKLAITGCNFNEENMCDMVSLIPQLKEIKLGSHHNPSMTTLGSAGGDVFAKTLSERCPLLVSADLTGMLSMTETGWNR
jgi:Leucine-rich repeat (LRR) protein